MKLLLVFARRYPRRTTVTMLCLVLAGLAEGIGVSSILPLLRLAAPGVAPGAGASTALEERLLALFNSIGGQPSPRALFTLALAGVLLKALLVLVAYRQVGYTVAHTATSLRLDLIRALLATRWQYYVHQPIGLIANSVAVEAQAAAEAYLRATMICAVFVQAAVYATVACLVSWQAAAVTLAAGTVIVLALNGLIRMARRAGARQIKLTRRLLARFTDTLQVVKPLKAMAREPLIAPVLESEARKLNRALQREVVSTAAMDSLQEPLIFLFLALALYGAFRLMAMPLADGIMLVFLCARVLAGLGRVQKEVQRMAAREGAFWALRDLTAQAHAALETASGTRVPVLQHEIRLVDVGFTYDGERVLRDASLVIHAGSLTVITGPSGAGKTTVADLIIGLLQPTAGDVLVDGVPLRELDTRRWREMLGYVPQETMLLHDTVAMNVSLGDPAASTDDVVAALRAAGAWEFVEALPARLDTVVGERGLRLSGGQRQRIALARALVRRPELLILDEATTALDPATERGICETLRRLAGSVTLVAICHHGHLVEVADQVYRVANGDITPVRTTSHADGLSAAGG
jgi:ATP-binding cassette subfamily C protein